MAAECFQLMSLFTGESHYHDQYLRIVKAGARLVENAPSAAGHLLAVLATARMGLREVALTGPEAPAWAGRLAATYRPNVVIAPATEPADEIPLLAGRFRPSGTHGFVCEQMVCQLPVTTYEALTALL